MLRPFRFEEIPVGGVLAIGRPKVRCMIIGAVDEGLMGPAAAVAGKSGVHVPPVSEMLEDSKTGNLKWKWPGEPDSALRPFGVEEE